MELASCDNERVNGREKNIFLSLKLFSLSAPLQRIRNKQNGDNPESNRLHKDFFLIGLGIISSLAACRMWQRVVFVLLLLKSCDSAKIDYEFEELRFHCVFDQLNDKWVTFQPSYPCHRRPLFQLWLQHQKSGGQLAWHRNCGSFRLAQIRSLGQRRHDTLRLQFCLAIHAKDARLRVPELENHFDDENEPAADWVSWLQELEKAAAFISAGKSDREGLFLHVQVRRQHRSHRP